MTPSIRPLLAAALLALVPAIAVAQSTAPATEANETGRPLAVCRADIAKICPTAKGGARHTCLENNTAKLSQECATAFADVEAKAKAMREACAEDVKAHCASSKGGAIVQCLRGNTAKLTSACNAAVSARFAK